MHGKGVAALQSHSLQSYVVPSIRTLIAEAAKKSLSPQLKTSALVLVLMLVMVISALALGAWWDRLSTGL
jgi:hypothetical protein